MTQDFQPQQAIETLRNYKTDLEQLSGDYICERVYLQLLSAELMDAEQKARDEFFDKDPWPAATLLSHMIKRGSHKQKQAYQAQRAVVDQLEIKMKVLQESINLIKAAHRISLTEINNLNL